MARADHVSAVGCGSKGRERCNWMPAGHAFVKDEVRGRSVQRVGVGMARVNWVLSVGYESMGRERCSGTPRPEAMLL